MKPLARNAAVNSRKTMTGIVIGTTLAAIVSFLLTMGLTSLIMKGSVPENAPNVYVFFIRSISVLLGCLAATVLVKEKNLQTIGIVTAAYLLIMLGCGIIFYDGSFHNFGIGLLSATIGGGIACIIKIIPQKKKYHLPKFKK